MMNMYSSLGAFCSISSGVEVEVKYIFFLVFFGIILWRGAELSEAGMPKVGGKTLTTFYQNWVIYKQSVRFLVDRQTMLTVSDYCGTDPSPSSPGYNRCQAIRVLSKVDINQLDSKKMIGGKNPGTVLCAQNLGGQVVYGTDRFRNQKTFCQFDDQSMVASDTLVIYGVKNGKK